MQQKMPTAPSAVIAKNFLADRNISFTHRVPGRCIAARAWRPAAIGAALVGTIGVALAQSPPPVAMRPAELRRDLIQHATIVVKPGERIDDGAILLENGWITSVGKSADVQAPAGTTLHDAKGLTIYPGLIDAGLVVESASLARTLADDASAHWNRKVTPQLRVVDLPVVPAATRKELRDLGFTIAAVHPNSGIFRGESAVVLLAEDDRKAEPIVPAAGQVIAFAHIGDDGPDDSRYPAALMGAMALTRQTLLDAQWRAKCEQVWNKNPQGNDPPERSAALQALQPLIQGGQIAIFDVGDEHDLLRAARLAKEFGLQSRMLGNGLEFRRLAEIADAKVSIVVPLEFPKTPDVSDPRKGDSVSLRELSTWALAPRNAKQLLDAGVDVSIGTHRLKSRAEFPARARRVMDEGLSEDALLACLTVRPAKQLGISALAGSIESGRMANLVVTDGPLFGEKTHVRTTWVAGIPSVNYEPLKFAFNGAFTLKADKVELTGVVDTDAKSISFERLPVAAEVKPVDAAAAKVADAVQAKPVEPAPNPEAKGGDAPVKVADAPMVAPANAAVVTPANAPVKVVDAVPAAPAAAKPPEPVKYAAERLDFDIDRVGFTLKGEAFGVDGLLRCTAVVVGDGMQGTAETSNGRVIAFAISKREIAKAVEAAKPADAVKVADAAKLGDTTKPADAAKLADATKLAPAKTIDPLAFIPRTTPLGEYGLEKPAASQTVLVKNAAIWTCGPAGKLQAADLLVQDGKVKEIGNALKAPTGALVIDATGKHVTPGLIDCHSHTGITGGVNEWTKNDTAECRINDCIDPDAQGWFRELAGGLTVANQLHGSANPIGGQNSVVKLKWGGSSEDFRFSNAIGGIKFALGENVTRPRNRYPNTRMGVEALLRDSFRAAREYAAKQSAYAALTPDAQAQTMPPRRDLQLDTLAEILAGTRLVHCHSYRQDEILMLLRLADEFGFRIGTLQHVLEGYKVADEIAKHGAGASTFSDWWAYKMEVMDAIASNGSLMRDMGVVVSFNSDSDEMARRLNMEAAKAVRYGNCPPEEALKFVTLNPAKQLHIDNRVGSLEVGKDGDFVIWNGDPLSSFSLADSTWIEGACMFDRTAATAMRQRDLKTRAKLLELAVTEGDKAGAMKAPEAAKEVKPADAKPAAEVKPTMLTRMLDARRESFIDQVRRGRDPESIGPGDCGCGGSAEGWKILMEGAR